MKPNTAPEKAHVCPFCGCTYYSRPALSRTDNTTLICPDCGIREALSSIGVKPEEQEEIIASVHTFYEAEES
jgi:transcription elongation factor Elf1